MTAMDQDFAMQSGDSKVLSFTVLDENDVAVDITGNTIKWRLAKSSRSSVLLAKATGGSGISITDAVNGVFQVTLDPTDTDNFAGQYYHEAELTDLFSNISTISTGTATIRRDLIST
jgi:hypothetical protein